MIHVNLIDGRICTAIILPCSSTCLGLLSESSQVSKAQIYAHMKTFALSIKDISIWLHEAVNFPKLYASSIWNKLNLRGERNEEYQWTCLTNWPALVKLSILTDFSKCSSIWITNTELKVDMTSIWWNNLRNKLEMDSCISMHL